jgi:uncharacterized membrane protein SpoIIM required for sporulation
MSMLKRSAFIYASGFVFGIIISSFLIAVYPYLYFAFIEFLRQKIISQSAMIKNITLMIIFNNIIAACIASFGGTAVSKVLNLFELETSKNKAIFYFLPVGILFVNGEVLGLLAVLYMEHVKMFLFGILPHGAFEIPAIILSGAIGLEITEETKGFGNNFQSELTKLARGKLLKFSIVAALIIIAGILEGRSF